MIMNESGREINMSSTSEILTKIISEFKSKGYSKVKDYKSFGYIRETKKAVIISREAGEDTRIPFKKIEQGIEAVKDNPSVYSSGPNSLRAYGITHINSPIWSLLHLVSKDEY